VYEQLRDAGYELFVVSYDSVDVLAEAAEELGLRITMLADPGSRFISSLGLLNEAIAHQDEADGVEYSPDELGAAHPGIFVLDEDGHVTERLFHRHYRIRPTGRTLLETLDLGGTSTRGPGDIGGHDEVELEAWASDGVYESGQQINLHVLLWIGAGVHVYAPGVEPPLTPLAVELRGPAEVRVEPYQYPRPAALTDPFLERDQPVYTGTTEIVVPFAIMEDVGDVGLAVIVRFQACTSAVCHPPRTLELAVQLRSR
jgi:peroxiredoxin